MRKLEIFEHISLDGAIQAGGSGDDDDYLCGDWTARRHVPSSSPSTQALPSGSVVAGYTFAGSLKKEGQ